MNTISISGWQACVSGFERRAWLALAVVAASAALASAQTGTFPIIDGAGAGNNVVAFGGVVVGPGATNGNLSAEHLPTCAGPEYHFHGVLLGLLDPSPAGCGWGHVNYTAMVPPAPLMTPTIVTMPEIPTQILQRQTAVQTQLARRQFQTRNQEPFTRRIVPAGQVASALQQEPQAGFVPRTAGEVLALKYSGGPTAGGRLLPTALALRKTFAQFAAMDSQHAMKQTPRPLVRTIESTTATTAVTKRTRSPFWNFSLTGPEAKLNPSEPSKPQP